MPIEIKTVGASGQISLGKQYAGRTVTVEKVNVACAEPKAHDSTAALISRRGKREVFIRVLLVKRVGGTNAVWFLHYQSLP